MKKYIIIVILGLSMFNNNFVFASDASDLKAAESPLNAAYEKKYKLLETIGNNRTGETVAFPIYVSNLYKFAIGFVALAALLMITLGGFAYMTAAGNQAQVGTAKKLIVDAILGLVVVFVSWLILYTINPDLLGTDPMSGEGLNNVAATASTTPVTNEERIQEHEERVESNLKKVKATTHSNKRVIQKVEGVQTYCSKENVFGTIAMYCANSKSECEANASDGKCIESSNVWDSSKLYESRGEGVFSEITANDCKNSGVTCIVGAEMKALTKNNVKTVKEIDEEIKKIGGSVSEGAKKKLNNMTEITLKNAKKLIEISKGGVITDAKDDGATYMMSGNSEEKVEEWKATNASNTVKILKEMYKNSMQKNSSDKGKIEQTIIPENGIAYVKYEFSPDYHIEGLRGMVATYNLKKNEKREGPDSLYSDVTVVAAQKIISEK